MPRGLSFVHYILLFIIFVEIYVIYNIYLLSVIALTSKGCTTSLQMNVYYDEKKCDGTTGKHGLERNQLSRVQLGHSYRGLLYLG